MRKQLEAVLFDLDGTLLPMDMKEFTDRYFALLAKKALPYGYEARELVKNIWTGTKAMVLNDGSCTNEERFWECFAQMYGEDRLKDRDMFEEFYANEFGGAKAFCGFNPMAAGTVRLVKDLGLRVVLATNPLFPDIATRQRIAWAGLAPEDFELYTTYENCRYCKPNPDYYREVMEKTGLDPEACLMVGNDVDEDMVAGTLGMRVFLLTDCLINAQGKDISGYPHGGFEELMQFLRENTRS